MKKNLFSPLYFLASLGAGGISIIPFAFLNYTYEHGAGLIQKADLSFASMGMLESIGFHSLELVMIVFSALHLILSAIYIKEFISWWKTEDRKKMINNPLKNTALLAPLISLPMTLNIFIGPIRYFSPWMSDNLQSMMLPAMLAWSAIWLLGLFTTIHLLKIAFSEKFDVSKINFGWLLYSFALTMISVTGSGIAAMASNPTIAHIAAFMSLVTISMAAFLFMVKITALFHTHFAASGMPDKQLYPSFLIVIPNVTLFAITVFRLLHYFEHQQLAEVGSWPAIIVTSLFAFEIWYMLFGLYLLKDYLKQHLIPEYYLSQWGLICPLVAFAVLGSFVHKQFLPTSILYYGILIVTAIVITLFFFLLWKDIKLRLKNK